jgi:hypothetical protein
VNAVTAEPGEQVAEVETGRRCALARCTRRATATIHACGVVHLCAPCLAIVARLAEDIELPPQREVTADG